MFMGWRVMPRAMMALVLVTIVSVAMLIGSVRPPMAETGVSSWFQRLIPKKPRKTQSVPAKPVQPAAELEKAAPASGKRLKRASLGKTMVVPSGDDAAYIAFDQGQYLTALRLAEAKAKQDDPQAHTLIGRLYSEGLGVPQNELTAAKWYRRGAELGDIEAMFAFGVMLASGKSIKKDPAGAAQMFERAAMKGHAYAHYNLGLLFLSGKGKPENPYRAAQHLGYAARKGIAEAQYDLAALYQRGHGVEPDAYKAAQLLHRAANKGLTAAQYEYAVMLLRGHGLNADRPKALDYLKAAADKGLGGAQNRLAHIYAIGIVGTAKNPVEAAKWRMIARDNGIKDKALDAKIAKYPKNVLASATAAAQRFGDRALVGIGGGRTK